MLIKNPPDIRSAEITPKSVYMRRREFIQASAAALVTAGFGSLAGDALAQTGVKLANVKKSPFSTTEAPNTFEHITSYNNFYEFAPGAGDGPMRNSKNFKPQPWKVAVEGHVAKPASYNFDDLVAKCRRESPKWDIVDFQYWALSKKQYHGPYSNEAWQAMSGSMRAGDSLAKIPVPVLILKADAPAEQRKVHLEAASVIQKGKLVHIDGAAHNLHHDQLAKTVEVLEEFLSTL